MNKDFTKPVSTINFEEKVDYIVTDIYCKFVFVHTKDNNSIHMYDENLHLLWSLHLEDVIDIHGLATSDKACVIFYALRHQNNPRLKIKAFNVQNNQGFINKDTSDVSIPPINPGRNRGIIGSNVIVYTNSAENTLCIHPLINPRRHRSKIFRDIIITKLSTSSSEFNFIAMSILHLHQNSNNILIVEYVEEYLNIQQRLIIEEAAQPVFTQYSFIHTNRQGNEVFIRDIKFLQSKHQIINLNDPLSIDCAAFTYIIAIQQNNIQYDDIILYSTSGKEIANITDTDIDYVILLHNKLLIVKNNIAHLYLMNNAHKILSKRKKMGKWRSESFVSLLKDI